MEHTPSPVYRRLSTVRETSLAFRPMCGHCTLAFRAGHLYIVRTPARLAHDPALVRRGAAREQDAVLLLALHSQEAYEDDEHDGKDDLPQIGEEPRWMGNGSALQGEGRLTSPAFPTLMPASWATIQPPGQQQRKKQQAGLEVAPERSPDEGGEDKDEPAQETRKS